MKQLIPIFMLVFILGSSCTSQKKLAYLNNLPTSGNEIFTTNIPDYKIQYRDILYITAKAMTPDGVISDVLSSSRSAGGTNYLQSESGQSIYGFDVNKEGNIILPVIGQLKVSDLTLDEARVKIQSAVDTKFNYTTVECKLLSFKFTVIGEVKSPGTYVNYNNYLTVLEGIGRAGGIGDLGRRDRILIIRSIDGGTETFRINLHDKNIITSQAYFLLPNDVVIVEPVNHKIFNLNLPTISFILTSITSTISMLILILNFTK
jgi:polysaccharide biosynthesis/export protein